jgi:penicillin-binding protein 1A
MCAVPNLVIGTWVGGEENTIRFLRSADGSRIALPITGKFLSKVYKDGSLGVNREDKFKFTTKAPKFNCKMPASKSTTTSAKIKEEDFKNSEVVPIDFTDQEGDFF